MSKQRRYSVGSLGKATTPEEYEAILRTVPVGQQPTRIADFGYEYNRQGELVQKASRKPFAWLGQKHYDALGDAIVNDIYHMLEAKYGLQRLMFPLGNAQKRLPQIPVFVSPDYLTAETLVVLCQGSGAVRPGMWARALCINDSLSVGTIFTYLDSIRERGWGVIVCNPNENHIVMSPAASSTSETETLSREASLDFWLGTADEDWKRMALSRRRELSVAVPNSDTPMNHIRTLWEELVRPAAAAAVPIIAHSFGGKCTTSLIETHFAEVDRRVPAIAWTDAINDMFSSRGRGGLMAAMMPIGSPAPRGELLKQCRALVKSRSINWVASTLALDTALRGTLGCVELSSGHDVHEWTSASCHSSVFRFLDYQLERWKKPPTKPPAGEKAPQQ